MSEQLYIVTLTHESGTYTDYYYTTDGLDDRSVGIAVLYAIEHWETDKGGERHRITDIHVKLQRVQS